MSGAGVLYSCHSPPRCSLCSPETVPSRDVLGECDGGQPGPRTSLIITLRTKESPVAEGHLDAFYSVSLRILTDNLKNIPRAHLDWDG